MGPNIASSTTGRDEMMHFNKFIGVIDHNRTTCFSLADTMMRFNF